MPKNKPSFFERLTGTIKLDDYDPDSVEFEYNEDGSDGNQAGKKGKNKKETGGTKKETGENEQEIEIQENNDFEEENAFEGELTVDVFETPDDIIIKTMVAGSNCDNLDISISREIVQIKGERHQEDLTGDGNYHMQELYWGSFSRTIQLPAEIEPDEAEAIEKHGLLTIRLPKINKDKQTKLKVKSA